MPIQNNIPAARSESPAPPACRPETMKTIQPARLRELLALEPAAAVIDLRTPAEYAQAHVPGAHNIPLDQLAPRALVYEGALWADETVYLISQTSAGSTEAAAKFTRDGLENAVIVEGGALAWKEAGLPVERGAAGNALEKRVSAAAGVLVLTGVILGGFVSHWPMALCGSVAAMGWGLVKIAELFQRGGPSRAYHARPLNSSL